MLKQVVSKVKDVASRSVHFELWSKKSVVSDSGKDVWEKVEKLDSFTAKLDDLTEGLILEMALHGLSQKVGDKPASEKDAAKRLEISKEEWNRLVKEKTFNKITRIHEPKVAVSQIEANMREQGLDEETIKKVLGSAYVGI